MDIKDTPLEKNFTVGVDVGGQSAKIGIVDKHGIVIRKSRMSTKDYGKDDAKKFVNDLAKAINKLIDESGKRAEIRGVGVGAPNGNRLNGEIAFAPNLPWAANGAVPFKDLLEKAVGGDLTVTITNDANAAAMGEMMYGAAMGMKNFIMITLGTGVGSGIVINGQMVYGHDGFAGELGHTIAVRTNGRPCGCGRKGCLEAYCSAIGVAKTAKEWLAEGEPSLLLKKENIEAKDVFEAAKAGDPLAIRVFEYTGTILGRQMAEFIPFSAPEAIIIFGGLTGAKEFLEGPIVKAMNDNVLSLWKNKVKVLFSQMEGDDAAIAGASALAWE